MESNAAPKLEVFPIPDVCRSDNSNISRHGINLGGFAVKRKTELFAVHLEELLGFNGSEDIRIGSRDVKL